MDSLCAIIAPHPQGLDARAPPSPTTTVAPTPGGMPLSPGSDATPVSAVRANVALRGPPAAPHRLPLLLSADSTSDVNCPHFLPKLSPHKRQSARIATSCLHLTPRTRGVPYQPSPQPPREALEAELQRERRTVILLRRQLTRAQQELAAAAQRAASARSDFAAAAAQLSASPALAAGTTSPAVPQPQSPMAPPATPGGAAAAPENPQQQQPEAFDTPMSTHSSKSILIPVRYRVTIAVTVEPTA